MDNPYEVLGIAKDASAKDIKKAYKSLAAKYHPDRNKDADAEGKFKQVNDAFDILGDEQKRQQYDLYGSVGARNNLNDLFSSFSQIFNPVQPRQVIHTQITLKEAFQGCEKTLNVDQFKTCDKCSGTGVSSWDTCSVCKGRGQRILNQGIVTIQTACPACFGKGRNPKENCKDCDAGRVFLSTKPVTFVIPQGIDTGTQIRIPKEGSNSDDLFVAVSVLSDNQFKRVANDLFYEVPLKYSQFVLGTSVDVKFLDDRVISVKIPKGTQINSKLKLSGEGMPFINNPYTRGNFYVLPILAIPTNISPEYEEQLKKLDAHEI